MCAKTVCVIGLGYIGLPTAVLIAHSGYTVIGIDIDPHVVNTVNRGEIHIVEPGLDVFVREAVASGRFSASTKPLPGDIYIICVPTPFHESGKTPLPNLDYVFKATKSFASLMKPGDMVILESTSPVGTTHQIAHVLKEAGADISKIHIAYCPERVLPGKIVEELVENDRVIGGLTPEAGIEVSNFYRTFVRGSLLITEAKAAEMCKLVENSFRDVNIAFANELSMICAGEGLNVWDVIQLANRHPRVNILQPGVGVGGHCIAVDPWFLVARDPENTRLIRSAREINIHKTTWVIDQIKIEAENFSKRTGQNPKVACFGLAFKPDIDDLRESPALQIATTLLGQGYDVMAVEPNIRSHDKLNLVSIEHALYTADVLTVLVNHRQFSVDSVKQALKKTGALDFCGMLRPCP